MRPKLNFLVISQQDIEEIFNLYGSVAYDCNWYTCSLEAYGRLKRRGLRNIHLLINSGMNDYGLGHSEYEFDQIARELDHLFSDARLEAKLLNFESPGWDYLSCYFMLQSFSRYGEISRLLSRTLPPSIKYEVIIPNVSPDYYLDSFCLRSTLLRGLSQFDISCLQYASPKMLVRENMYASKVSLDSLPDGLHALISVPTFIHPRTQDLELFNSFGGRSASLQSPFFEERARGYFAPLVPFYEGHDEPMFRYKLILRQRVFPVLKRACSGISSRALFRVLERSVFQVRYFKSLCLSPKLNSIHTLVITDHDGGIQGPLLSWASLMNAKIVVVPHSSIHNIPLPHLPTEVEFTGKLVPGLLPLGFFEDHRPEPFTSRSDLIPQTFHIRKSDVFQGGAAAHILIVHNNLDDYANYPCVDIKDYISAINILIGLDSFEVRHKFKPRKASKYVFPTWVDFDNKASAIRWASLVIGIGQPSSFLWDCDAAHKHSIHVSSYQLGLKSDHLLPASTFRVVRGSLTSGFEYVRDALLGLRG